MTWAILIALGIALLGAGVMQAHRPRETVYIRVPVYVPAPCDGNVYCDWRDSLLYGFQRPASLPPIIVSEPAAVSDDAPDPKSPKLKRPRKTRTFIECPLGC